MLKREHLKWRKQKKKRCLSVKIFSNSNLKRDKLFKKQSNKNERRRWNLNSVQRSLNLLGNLISQKTLKSISDFRTLSLKENLQDFESRLLKRMRWLNSFEKEKKSTHNYERGMRARNKRFIIYKELKMRYSKSMIRMLKFINLKRSQWPKHSLMNERRSLSNFQRNRKITKLLEF
jgi:hypothetical protein